MPVATRARDAPRRSSGTPASPLAKYERVRELGRGSYGVVWLMRRRSDRRLLAMKTVLLPPLACHEEKAIAERRQAIREAEILQMLESPHLVQYAEAVLTPASTAQPQSELNLLTEYCDAGDLSVHLRKIGGGRGLPERSVWGFAVAILLGLHELHSRQILHRDLKPANIFLTRADHRSRSQSRGRSARCGGGLHSAGDGPALSARVRSVGGCGAAGDFWVRVGDLGLARAMTGSHPLASTMVGSPLYCAPEIFEGTPYGEKADIYSFGVCIYELMHGRPPYGDVQNVGALVRQVLNLDGTQPPLSMDPRYSEELRSFVGACLARSVAERPTASELIIRLPRAHAVALPTAASTESTNLASPESADAAGTGQAHAGTAGETPRHAGHLQAPSTPTRQIRSPPQKDHHVRSPTTQRGMTRSPSSPAAPVTSSPRVVQTRTPSPHAVHRSRSSPRLSSARTPSPCGFRGVRQACPSFKFQPPRRASEVASPVSARNDGDRIGGTPLDEVEQEKGEDVEIKAPVTVDSPKHIIDPVPRETARGVPQIITSIEECLESALVTPTAIQISVDSTLNLEVDTPATASPQLPAGASAWPPTHQSNRARAQSLNTDRSGAVSSAEPASARQRSRPTSQPPAPTARSSEACPETPRVGAQKRLTLPVNSNLQQDAEICMNPASARVQSKLKQDGLEDVVDLSLSASLRPSELSPFEDDAPPCSVSTEGAAQPAPTIEMVPSPGEASPASLGRTASSNPWDALRHRQGLIPAKRTGIQDRSKAYVAKAQEYWKRWRRERQEAKAVEARAVGDVRSPGRADGRALQKGCAREVPCSVAGSAECKQVLEVRGVAHPRSIAPSASPGTPGGRRAARGSLGAARVLYTPPPRRTKGLRA